MLREFSDKIFMVTPLEEGLTCKLTSCKPRNLKLADHILSPRTPNL